MSLPSLLRQRATIERADRAVSAAGDVTTSWGVVAQDVPCLIELRDVAEEAAVTGLRVASQARAFLPPETDLRPRPGAEGRDRLRVDGLVWRVTGARIVAGRRERLLLADLVRAA